MLEKMKKAFGLDPNDRALKRYRNIVHQINDLEPEIKGLSDSDLSGRTNLFRERLDNGESLDSLLPEVFATVREVSVRTMGMRHFDVQLMGGIALHEANIAEMKTGEGKTLVATLAVVLNSLSGKGVHIITVNDYLSRRDAEWMAPIYRYLGLEVGVIYPSMDPEERYKAYRADVTYGTNSEFGFDYLRDNMVMSASQMVQRGHNFCIVDEVDSILIDEARTPLIISGPSDDSPEGYITADRVARQLKRDRDFEIDEKEKNINFTEEGISKCEEILSRPGLFSDVNNSDLAHNIMQAVKAHVLFQKDVHYVVKEGEIVIVDEFTGRLMFGRRYSDGLHQAIEAKEKVKVGRESQTLATITLQNYFRMYGKLSGMTGTAWTESEEFHDIYGLGVIVIPTNEPMIRKDHPDVIYRSKNEKFSAVADEIEETWGNGQPTLVGTTSIENSEKVSRILKARKIPHNVLNAKNHEREANIIAQAGRLKAVTVATNMAGRGTDIMLGGNPDFMAREKMEKDGVSPDSPDQKEVFHELHEKIKEQCDAEKEEVKKLGGLKIIGTERHEARRIDNQLRGRSGRQGDPGSSRFYLALEDDLLRLFGSEKIQGIMSKLGLEEGEAIEHGMLSKAIESAQKKVEQMHFDIRKQLLAFDNVMNQQREAVYAERADILNDENIIDHTWEIMSGVISEIAETYFPEQGEPDPDAARTKIKGIFGPGRDAFMEGIDHRDDMLQALEKFREEIKREFYGKISGMDPETSKDLFRFVVLHTLDHNWKDHLLAMDELRRGIGLRAIGQKDPLLEYQFESYNLFQEMMARVRTSVADLSMRVSIVKDPPLQDKKRDKSRIVEGRDLDVSFSGGRTGVSPNNENHEKKYQPVRKGPKIGRNDPCPCGSGKKYKHCCGRNN
jgi:preprotein translocase subunit SecA